MATVCGSSLALMDAGVPLKRPTAGIAMGLILEGERFAVLSDILGDEDHLGDMDFKVAGTSEGVTSLQMDIKIAGITEEIMRQALAQARDGRMHILGEMSKALTGARAELGEFAPRIETMKIPTDKIREVIGTGGKVIREIVEKTGAKINIEDDGTVKIASSDGAKIKAAVNWIKSIASEPEVGQIYDGTVVKTVEFGAFVNFFGSKDGLVHISQLAKTRVNKTTDVVKEGDRVKVKVMGYDDRGKVKLSMRVVDQQTGADLEKAPAAGAGGDGRVAKPNLEHYICVRRITAPHKRFAASAEAGQFPSRNGLLTARKGRVRYGVCASAYGLNLMQVSFAAALDDGRRTIAIGRIRATGPWRAAGDPGAEADRQTAIEALRREAEDYGADGVVDVRSRSRAARAARSTGSGLSG